MFCPGPSPNGLDSRLAQNTYDLAVKKWHRDMAHTCDRQLEVICTGMWAGADKQG